MGLGIVVPIGGGGRVAEMWMCDRRLCLTEDNTRVVPEDTPAARWLWATPGQQVPLSEAIRLGAVQAPEPEPAPEVTVEGDGIAKTGTEAPPDGTATELVNDGEDGGESTSPAGNASTDEWRAYAVAKGMDPDEAAKANRDRLRELYAAKDA